MPFGGYRCPVPRIRTGSAPVARITGNPCLLSSGHARNSIVEYDVSSGWHVLIRTLPTKPDFVFEPLREAAIG